MRKPITRLPLLALLFVAPVALADTGMSGMTGMNTEGDMQGLSPASQAYISSMADMHEHMLEGVKDDNPDVAFAQGMIPHHQGAVAMAEIELKYGKDPQLRGLAENIIKAQQAEIKFMQAWLDAHPHDTH
ncbi:CopM family metallochaperone [Martelella alba]|uniref:DUF305 domain-containing protein n=1 Tax=Martelella alba TaxID=2590451 RepID=A0ABY2SRD8_9HYPH|nr:DUF305 domain-containing protein [Martelella alba]TKI08322.1 DUF305 domain-containing protein [Martelella alba]